MALDSAGTAVLSAEAGSRSRFTFTGTGVKWIGYRDEWSGTARVYVDGVLQATVDTYASPAQAQTVLYSKAGLTSATHTVEIETTGQHNSASGGAWVWVDAFDVTSGGGTVAPGWTRLEQTDPSIAYVKTWAPMTGAVYSASSAGRANVAASKATVTFTGTGFRWIGYRDAASGKAAVFLDGNRIADVDTYFATPKAQALLLQRTGLVRKTHTLTVYVTGNKRAASGGTWVWVDAFEVYN
jgi:hypothetical protein